MKMKITSTAREQAFNDSTLRQSSQFERVQVETTVMPDEVNSETALAVHRADSASGRKRDRGRGRGRGSERGPGRPRERRGRGRGQAAMSGSEGA